jgi:hypothetical protein
MPEDTVEPRIVAAVGNFTAHSHLESADSGVGRTRSDLLQEIHTMVVQQCLDEGLSPEKDADEIRSRKHRATDLALEHMDRIEVEQAQQIADALAKQGKE